MNDDKLDWKQMSKQELFLLAKWHEARAEVWREVAMTLMRGDDPVKYELSVGEK